MLALHDLSMNFGGVKALDGLSLHVTPGALHGLIGPNGAGKTTAMNVISGLYRASAGSMTLGGAPFHPRSHDLARQGLARTFQAAALVDSLNAFGNVLLGDYARTRASILSCALRLPAAVAQERAACDRARAALEEVGFTGRDTAGVAELSSWQRRQVEIARALMIRPRLMLLDEPAAGLTATEVDQLTTLLDRLRRHGGLSILLVEHNVPLVFGICDAVTAMVDGRDVAHGPPATVRRHPEVLRAYLGSGVAAYPARPKPGAPKDRPAVLELRDVSAGYGPNTVLHDISISVRAGEAVAIFGPNGAGKSTLFNTIAGERRVRAGRIDWHGDRIDGRSMQAIVRAGIGLVPQGRAVLERQTVEDNLLISTSGLRLRAREFRDRVDEIYAHYPSLGRRRKLYGASLSGGERQMLAIAKALIRRPSLLLLDEPSIGLAPTVIEELQRTVARLTASGIAVIIGEQAVDWVIPLATRAYVLGAGRIVSQGPANALAEQASLAEHYLGAQHCIVEPT